MKMNVTSKPQKLQKGIKKYRSFMSLNLNYQFKASRYIYRSTEMKPMVTTNQKSAIVKTKTRQKGTNKLKKIIKPQVKKL